MNERIVCAALSKRGPNGKIILGVRHFDDVMRKQISLEEVADWWDADQGFLTNRSRFVDRYEAYQIAKAEGQIIRDTCTPGMLSSENLY